MVNAQSVFECYGTVSLMELILISLCIFSQNQSCLVLMQLQGLAWAVLLAVESLLLWLLPFLLHQVSGLFIMTHLSLLFKGLSVGFTVVIFVVFHETASVHFRPCSD